MDMQAEEEEGAEEGAEYEGGEGDEEGEGDEVEEGASGRGPGGGAGRYEADVEEDLDLDEMAQVGSTTGISGQRVPECNVHRMWTFGAFFVFTCNCQGLQRQELRRQGLQRAIKCPGTQLLKVEACVCDCNVTGCHACPWSPPRCDADTRSTRRQGCGSSSKWPSCAA